MRKQLITEDKQLKPSEPERDWLDLEKCAQVELTSEDAAYPIESALLLTGNLEWRAGTPGKQTIRLCFDNPQHITHIHLSFEEHELPRTQEFVLNWSAVNGDSVHEIVRQQYNFSPPENTREREDFHVNLDALLMLELIIIPDISGGESRASLTRLRLA